MNTGVVGIATLDRGLADGQAVAPSSPDGDVLLRLARATAGASDLAGLLRPAAPLLRRAVGARRCSVFVADAAGTRLCPVWSDAEPVDAEALRRFLAVPPVDLDAVPGQARLFRQGRVVTVADLARSSVAPTGLAASFGARSALLAPLHHDGVAVGLVVLDWPTPGRTFSTEEQRLAGDLASVLAPALARLAADAPSVPAGSGDSAVPSVAAHLLDLAARFVAAPDVTGVLRCLDASLEELLGARLDAVDVAPSGLVPDTIVQWRPRPPLRQAASAHLARADEQRGGTVEPRVVPSAPGSAVLLPLTVDGRALGSITVVPSPERPLEGADLETAGALAALAAAAVARAAHEDGLRLRLHHAEALYRLSDAIAGTGDIETALRELNRTLPAELGITLESICIANAQMRATVGADGPTDHELEVIRSWRSVLAKGRTPLQARPVDGGLLVPVAHRSRVQGALRVRVDGERGPVVDDLLLAIGTGCADVVHRAALQEHLAESERRLVVANERERLAQDLHDSVAQIVTGMGMRLAQYVADAPNRLWRMRLEELLRMAARGNREIRAAIHALLFLDTHREGLPTSVRALVRKFEVTTGLPVRFVLRGTPTALASAKEDALFRVAHEALMNVERHSRAALASVQLTYSVDAVSLAVRDDGVGLGHRDPFGVGGGHFGIRAMQQRLEAVGGELRVRNARPRGVVVEARVAKNGTRNPSGSARKKSRARGAANATGARGGHR